MQLNAADVSLCFTPYSLYISNTTILLFRLLSRSAVVVKEFYCIRYIRGLASRPGFVFNRNYLVKRGERTAGL